MYIEKKKILAINIIREEEPTLIKMFIYSYNPL